MQETKRPQGWPEGKPLAVSVNVMLEGWSENSAPGIGPMGNPLKAGALDRQARSWAEYGPKVGAWRLLEILGSANVKATFYASGIIAEQYPKLTAEINAQGHVIAAHGWSQDVLPVYQTPEEEARDLDRCVSTLLAALDRRPRGWLSPRCTPSAETSTLLAESGFQWHADIFDSDLPYLIHTTAGPIVGLPFTMDVNDMPLSVHYGNEPEAFTRVLKRIVLNWPRLKSPGACLDLTVHAHIFGRPAGAIELVHAIDLVRSSDHCWLTSHGRLANLYLPATQ